MDNMDQSYTSSKKIFQNQARTCSLQTKFFYLILPFPFVITFSPDTVETLIGLHLQGSKVIVRSII